MFCEKCGKPLSDGAKFCAECGAKVGEHGVKSSDSSVGQSVHMIPKMKTGSSFTSGGTEFFGKMNMSGKEQDPLHILLLAAGILQAIMAILWFFRGTLYIYGISYSMHYVFLDSEIPVLSLIHVVLMLVSAILLIMSCVKGKKKRMRLLFQKTIAIISMVWFLTMPGLTAAAGELAKLGFIGWILFMACVSEIVFLFLISSYSKNYQVNAMYDQIIDK